MDYYQGVVIEYLRADRAIFVNTECCIQLKEAPNPDQGEKHWYCDALAVDFRSQYIYLCEVTYSKDLGALVRRLASWNAHWPAVKASLVQDFCVPNDWPVRPWLFVPEACITPAVKRIKAIRSGNENADVIPEPRITTLEAVAPWNYRSWNRQGESEKPLSIPEGMRK